MTRVGKFIDLSKCTGCRGCQVACKQWNQLPAEIEGFNGTYQSHSQTRTKTYTFVQIKEAEFNGKVEWHFRKHQCMHCGDPTCVFVCPHKNRSTSPEGVVSHTGTRCKACGYCEAKCPFKACKLDSSVKKTYNCWMCYDRITNGLTPACAKGCPTGAISFGDREQLVSQAKARLNEVLARYPEANLFGVNEFGGTGVIYLLLKAPSFYGLPLTPPSTDTWFGSANGVRDCYSCHGGSMSTYPAWGQTVSGIITATAYADVKSGAIDKMEYYLDGALIGSATNFPYSIPLDTTKYSDGLHKLQAKAYAKGGIKASTTDFYIKNGGTSTTDPSPTPPPSSEDTTPPSVSITSPTGGNVRGTITVKVNATDNVGVAKVDLYVQNQLAGSKTASPYDFSVDTTAYPNGNATIKAVAFDSAGNSGSAQVNVKIRN